MEVGEPNARRSMNRHQQGSLLLQQRGTNNKWKMGTSNEGKKIGPSWHPLSDAVGLSSLVDFLFFFRWLGWWTLAAGGYKYQNRGWAFGANWFIVAAGACILNEAEGILMGMDGRLS